ncbi:MAG: hypothetical protein JWN67_4615 [Actinomycetia bacterium]|nr:hypothetical protein [Actinomycetes bacterium]
MRTGAALVALAVLAGCGGDASREDPGPTSTTSTPSATSTTVEIAESWSWPCQETSDDPTASSRGSATFGPLGAAPSIVVHLPRTGRDVAHPDQLPRVAWGRLHGATVVSAAPGESSDAATSMVTAVDDDGRVRWTRCVDGTVTALGTGDHADVVLVVVYPLPGRAAYTKDGATLLLDAADGHQRDRLDRTDDVYATSSTWALIGRTDTDSSTPKILTLVDLTTGERTDVTPPPPTNHAVTFELTDDGEPRYGGSVWRGGRWLPEPDPPTVVSFDDSTQPSTLVAKTGDAVEWRVPIERPPLEGRGVVQDDRSVVVWSCGPRDGQGQCRLDLVGVDVGSGRVLWTEPARSRQQQILGVGGDDVFLAESGDTWVMRRMRTGQPIEGQRWTDRSAFLQGCCGDYDHYRAERFGGAVLVLSQSDVRIWFPKAQSHATVDVQP